MAEHFLNVTKTRNVQNQESQRFPSIRKIKKAVPRCIIIRLPKTSDKENILKAAEVEEKRQYIQRNKNKAFLLETLQARRQQLSCKRGKLCQSRILYPGEIPFKNRSEICFFFFLQTQKTISPANPYYEKC